MAKIEYQNDAHWEIESIYIHDILFRNWEKAVENLASSLSIEELSVTKSGNVFQYRWNVGGNNFGIDYEKVSGVWRQRFLASGWFETAHIGLQRPVTETLVPLIDRYGVTKIEFTW